MRYYTGTGYVFYIDLVYRLLWGGLHAPGVPIVERYREEEIDEALKERHALFPFGKELATQLNIILLDDGSGMTPDATRDYRDMRAFMHDDRAFANTFVTDSGETRNMQKILGERTARVLKAVGNSALSS